MTGGHFYSVIPDLIWDVFFYVILRSSTRRISEILRFATTDVASLRMTNGS